MKEAHGRMGEKRENIEEKDGEEKMGVSFFRQ